MKEGYLKRINGEVKGRGEVSDISVLKEMCRKLCIKWYSYKIL
jgi:hypothetical protein